MSWNRLLIAALFLLLPGPILIVVAVSFTSVGYLRFPPGELSLRWYAEFLSDQRWLDAMLTSVALAVAAAVLTTAVALMAALAVARKSSSRVASLFESMVLAPLVFPHAALGMTMVALAVAFDVYGTFAGLLLAHCIITLPFAYRPVSVSLRKADGSLEEAAMSLGSRPWNTFVRVTLPLMRPGLVTALLFTFIISFDEITISMFLVGPEVTTLPVSIYSYILESGRPVVAAISTALVALTIVLVLVLERAVGLELFVEAEKAR
ncbi:MAG: ABC transporter permease [Burkholderiales bacterium]|nr:ABC transporter permease [Burkholderiales bacterium]MCE7876126.1 ABC transporter permease [Betaproteobacteria bacterium PRO3]